ncbi:MAG: hypothetical protein WC628_07665 [Candidatus Omnitrophota bacterium]
MARPLAGEAALYKKIEKEKLTIPDPIWELIDHHLGNDLYAISLIAGSHVMGEDKEAIPEEDGEKIINHIEGMRVFLNKLRYITRLKQRMFNREVS